ncbi:Telomerase Cajal body protein 1 [Chionoecetes opilio]|uniref:WD repeat-containing protein 79 n=1 Tax=Chionoecetes opilio TaxID=41210 RepID=A0A8J4YLG2_CHIOP|nr:Telomerase Cajal body protein 1 [Chionoecetes opilio]
MLPIVAVVVMDKQVENSTVAMEKQVKHGPGSARKKPSVGAVRGNTHEEKMYDVVVISDESSQGVDEPQADMLPSQELFSLRDAAKTYAFQNGTQSIDTKEFLEEKITISKPREETIDTISGEHCNSGNQSGGEEVVMSETAEKDDSGGTVEGQEESPVSPHSFVDPLMVLNYSGEFKTRQDNFTKGCKWSPDGSCLLVTANDSKLRLFNVPTPVLQGDVQCESWFAEAEKYNKAAVTVSEKEIMYDYCWYPLMRSDMPNTCCLDEMVAAYSVGFNTDGTRLVAGFNKCLRAFHTHRPGRYFEEIEAKNQPGIISCMSFNPQLPCVFAAGSYLGSIGDTRGRVLKWDLEKDGEAASGDDFLKEPSAMFEAHKDCTNGVSVHPYCPLLATSSGQRHFPEPVSGSDLDSCSESDEPQSLFTTSRIFQENTVKLWWLGKS